MLHVGRQRRNKVPHQLIKECGGGASGFLVGYRIGFSFSGLGI